MSAGIQRYPHVFTPLALGPVELRNRVYMAPHGTAMEAPIPGAEGHRVPSAQLAHYLAERAAGGVGLMFVSVQIGPVARQQPYVAVSAWFEEAIASYRRLADLVHAEGAKLMGEIWYSSTKPMAWEALGPESPVFGASAVQHFGGPSVRYALRPVEIRRLIGEFGRTAAHLRDAGFDGIELHLSHGVLLEHFLSPYFNHRDDEYGGDLANRARIVVEALEAVRAQVGGELAVGARMTADQLLPGGLALEDSRALLRHLAATGLLDFVDLDISVEPLQAHLMTTSYFEPALHNLARVKELRADAGALKVLATPGRVTTVAEMERILADGAVDMVGAVRGLIAEPNLVRHALEGRERASRACIAANHCIEAGRMQGFGCALNAVVTREEQWGRRAPGRAPRALRVVVAGGGPAGLEAARVAAGRGHSVVLLEQRARVGGALEQWSRLPGREHLASVGRWFETQLGDAGVDLRTGVRADPATILAERPDVAFVATGARYAPDGANHLQPYGIPGSALASVYTPEAVLEGELELAGTVVIVDEEGLNTAVGLAERLAAQGCAVELVTSAQVPGAALAASHQLRYIVPRLRRAGVVVHALSQVRAIRPGAVDLLDLATGEPRSLDAVDAVVLATSRRPQADLREALEGRVGHVYLIGDALAPRGLREATYEGHRFGFAVGTDDMPADVISELFRPIEAARPAALA